MSSAIERLRVAHHLALRAQHSSRFDPAELLRAWPQIATSALAAEQTLAVAGPGHDRVIERVALAADAIRFAGAHQPWPGDGRADLALLQVSAALESAADPSLPLLDPEDVSEARWLLTSSLWTSSQIVQRATADYTSDLLAGRLRSNPNLLETATITTDVRMRLDAVEHLTAGALSRVGEPGPPEPFESRLRLAIATWDIEAHRALLEGRSSAVLHTLAHLEAESVKAVQVTIDGAAEHGVIDQVTAARLRPVLQDSSASWKQLRDLTGQLAFANTPVPLTFIDAARDLQYSLIGAARSVPSEHSTVPQAVAGHLASSVTISAATYELIKNGEIRAPARAMARMLAEQPEDRESLTALVSPIAVYRGETLPLPIEVRLILEEPARRVIRDAREALVRSSGLNVPNRDARITTRLADRAPTSEMQTPRLVTRGTQAGPPAP